MQLLLQLLLLELLEADLSLVLAQLPLLGHLLQCVNRGLQGSQFIPENALPVLTSLRFEVEHLRVCVHRPGVDTAVARGVATAPCVQQKATRGQCEVGGHVDARGADRRQVSRRTDRRRRCRGGCRSGGDRGGRRRGSGCCWGSRRLSRWFLWHLLGWRRSHRSRRFHRLVFEHVFALFWFCRTGCAVCVHSFAVASFLVVCGEQQGRIFVGSSSIRIARITRGAGFETTASTS
mmetsp:Transcript_56455/g.99174  ORF Transcript_56455/g.99174 Transcript_56455/m.99174 type:complete len:234 (+) Transcript_56455:132-833(+)